MKAQPKHSRILCAAALAALAAITPARAGSPTVSAKASNAPTITDAIDWKENTISPVTNPIFFEDPVIRTEIRPIFAYHRIDKDFITNGGDAEVYALQIRYAVTDRLAIIATQDGYMNINPGSGGNLSGWLDIAAGVKYALIDNKEKNFILTPGLTFSIPTGSTEIFHGRGSGEWNFFTSAEKGWGDFHLLGNLGLRVPNDTNEQSTILHYSLHADYRVCRLFIPFVEANGWTVLHHGDNLPLTSEGYDVFNFGSSKAGNVTQFTIGGGFRSRLTKNLDLGVAYEKAVADPYGVTDDRFTFDVCIRF
jgi:hypothetical protein